VKGSIRNMNLGGFAFSVDLFVRRTFQQDVRGQGFSSCATATRFEQEEFEVGPGVLNVQMPGVPHWHRARTAHVAFILGPQLSGGRLPYAM